MAEMTAHDKVAIFINFQKILNATKMLLNFTK